MNRVIQIAFMILTGVYSFSSCAGSGSDSEATSATDRESLAEQIKQLEDTLSANSDNKIDRKLAVELLNKSALFAETFPEDEQSPAYLFRAGNVAVGIGAFEDAVGYFQTVHKKYEQFQRAPDALFLEGFTYENHLKNIEKAKACYQDFLSRFPNDELAEQVKLVLESIDKTPEELVKGFQKENE